MLKSEERTKFGPLQVYLPPAPCVPIALAIATGIIFDRYLSLAPTTLIWSFLVLFACWLVAYRRRFQTISTASLFVLLMTLGALHHHRHWFDRAQDDVEQLLSGDRQLLRVRGRVVGFPATLVPDPGDQSGRPLPPLTRFNISVVEVKTLSGWAKYSGRLRVDVDDVVVAAPGDFVEVFGWAERFPSPSNPGEPDHRSGQQAQRVRGTLRPPNKQVILIDLENRTWLSAARLWSRQKCEVALRERLQGDSLATGLAFLLGDRSLLTNEIRNAFIETGTMHVLAISGVHITVLAMFVATLCRWMGCSTRVVIGVVLLVSAAYLAIADVRPPMTRAFVVITIWGFGLWLIKQSFTLNSLAVAALVIIGLNPTDLFDVGAQLSFLAVGTMIWWARLERRWLPGLFPNFRSELPSHWFKRLLRRTWSRLWRLAVRSLLLSMVIWLTTLPLVAATFHLISPIGPIINVPLAVVASPALWAGFLYVMISFVSPSLASVFGMILNALLTAMVGIVRWAASVSYGHTYVPAPPEWWLFCMYGLIVTLMLLWLFRRRAQFCLACVVAWSCLGATLALRSETVEGLRCTFLSVGHGCAVLVETPGGRVLAYDVGCKSAPDFAKRVMSHAVWKRHRRTIDALVLSHADSDHFNGTRGLLDTISISRVLVSPLFLATRQLGAIDALNAAHEHRVPIEPVVYGDFITLDPGVEIRVLHPSAAEHYESDNAGSVVIELKYAGRRILLTGDLEDSGLRALLKQEARPVDILMAPHHGSLNDNPSELQQWAKPKWVVASAGRTVSLGGLREHYGENTRLLATSFDGAIEFEISPTGRIAVQTYAHEIQP